MTPIPTSQLDAGDDSPKLARGSLLLAVTAVNQLFSVIELDLEPTSMLVAKPMKITGGVASIDGTNRLASVSGIYTGTDPQFHPDITLSDSTSPPNNRVSRIYTNNGTLNLGFSNDDFSAVTPFFSVTRSANAALTAVLTAAGITLAGNTTVGGTLTAGAIAGTSFAGSGAGLTNLNASNLTTGTIPIGRLSDSGTASATTFLSGDNSWKSAVTAVTVTTANGVSGVIANQGTTPAITLTLGAITPSSVVASGAISGTTLAGAGSAITALNASNLASGMVPLARLGTGTPDTTKYLRGDNSWANAVTAVTVATANGVSATVTNQGTTPALTFSLGDITPTSVSSSGAISGSSMTLPNNSAYSIFNAAGNVAQALVNLDTTNNLNFGQGSSVAKTTWSSGGGIKMTMDAAGNLGLGSTTPVAKLDVRGSIAALSSAVGGANYSTTKTSSGNANENGNSFQLINLQASNTARNGDVQAGKILWQFSQPTSGNAQDAASITVASDGPQSGTNTNSYLSFATTAAGATTATERVRIDNAGYVGIGRAAASGNQLDILTSANVTGLRITGSDDVYGIRLLNSAATSGMNLGINGPGSAVGGYISTDGGPFVLSTGGTNHLLVDTTGNALFGDVNGGGAPSNQFGHGGSNQILRVHNPNSSFNSQAHVYLSSNSQTTVQNGNGNSLGTISWLSPASSTTVMAYVGCTTGLDSTNSTPSSALVFATRSTTDTAMPIRRMTVDQVGNVSVGNALSGGMKFYVGGASTGGGAVSIGLDNTNTSGFASLRIGNGNTGENASGVALHWMNSNYASNNSYYANGATLSTWGTGGINLNASGGGSSPIRFHHNEVNTSTFTVGGAKINGSLVGYSFLSTNQTNTFSYLIATLPASTLGTYDQMTIICNMTDNWASTSNRLLKISLANRGSFTGRTLSIEGGALSPAAKIMAYSQSDGTVQVYVVMSANYYATMALDVRVSQQVSLVSSPIGTSVTPSGTVVYDSSTATPLTTVDSTGNFYCPGAVVFTADPAGNKVTGLCGSGNIADTFTYDTNKTLNHYGLTWKLLSDVPGGPSALLTAYGDIRFLTRAAERLRIDAVSGNIGVGAIVPSGWSTAYRVIGIGPSAAYGQFYGSSNSGGNGTSYGQIGIAQNSYFNGSNNIAIGTGGGSQYIQSGGYHYWYSSASVNAGSSQTMNLAMFLDPTNTTLTLSGALSPALILKGTNSGGRPSVIFQANGTTYWSTQLKGDASQNWYQISNSNETVGVYMTPTASGWNNLSDERFKYNWVELTDASAKVKTLRAGTHSWIEDETLPRDVGLIAQDVQAILPEAVDASNPDRLGVRYTHVVPLLVKALQESFEREEALQSRVMQLETQMAQVLAKLSTMS